MTNTIPSLPFPDLSNQSLEFRAKRKWTPPRLTIEQVTRTASGKPLTPNIEGTFAGITAGPAS